jgi:hypothetical protein
MSNIDFTKPVETVTGIPVQIISTSGREPYPVVGYVGEHSLSLDEWTLDGLFNLAELDYSEYNLRNKATQPQEPWAAEKAAFAAGETIQYKHPFMLEWKDFTGLKAAFERDLGIIWRIKPKPQKVPLEPCDVPPGSVIRYKLAKATEFWWMITSVSDDGVYVCSGNTGITFVDFQRAMKEMEIKRPTDTEWQPCYKETQP